MQRSETLALHSSSALSAGRDGQRGHEHGTWTHGEHGDGNGRHGHDEPHNDGGYAARHDARLETCVGYFL